ncbi:MAG: uracil-DNA glycosylase family protein [Pseudomonadota bacterium]
MAVSFSLNDLQRCARCAETFAQTATAHAPRPVTWFQPGARVLVAGQAPGMRVHKSGKPFDDPSGDRLRDWMGIDVATFYDKTRLAIVPMAFCFPGYDAKGSDLPPPKRCARDWRQAVLDHVGPVRVTLLVGGYAQEWHLGKGRVTDRVRNWRALAPHVFCLPHPSWRNTAWLKKHPWFTKDTLPALRGAVQEALA